MKERLIKISQDINSPSPSTLEGDSKYTLAPHTLKRIGTFHSVFLKILKEDIDHLEMKYNKNFGIYDTNETASVVKDCLKKLNLTEKFKPNDVKGFISSQKNKGIDYKTYLKYVGSEYDQSMYKLYEMYQKELEQSNSLDFDDLLLLPYLLFKKSPEVLSKWINRFDFLLVDEAQDTNWIQFELMKMMSGNKGNITLIGDDFQSIYGRR